MQDARRAARVYLEGAAALLDGANRTKLQEAARLYGDMLNLLLSAVPYELTAPVFNADSAPVWDKARRQTLAAALKECKELEQTARTVIRDILANWEE